jgi:hypothetical protein
MLRLKYFIFILVLYTATVVSAQIQDSTVSENEKPALEFDHMEYNFGTVTTDTVVSHIYNFKNVSLDTIKINKVGTS